MHPKQFLAVVTRIADNILRSILSSKKALLLILLTWIVFFLFHILTQDTSKSMISSSSELTKAVRHETTRISRFLKKMVVYRDEVVIVCVICGRQTFDEALVMMKSAILAQTHSQLKFIIMCELLLQAQLLDSLQHMRILANNSFVYHVYNVSFPAGKTEVNWSTYGFRCCTQRLFLPDLLTNVNSILYVDTDVIFLDKLSNIWRHVRLLNSSQIAAMVLNNEDPSVNIYSSNMTQVPVYGQLGLNSGVMFMNLAKMRRLEWVAHIRAIVKVFKKQIIYSDQDIINIYFNIYPEKLYVLPCSYNYRSDHCTIKNTCEYAQTNGVSILHGNRNIFRSYPKGPTFYRVYEAFQKYELGTDPYVNLLQPLLNRLQEAINTNCGKQGTHVAPIAHVTRKNQTTEQFECMKIKDDLGIHHNNCCGKVHKNAKRIRLETDYLFVIEQYAENASVFGCRDGSEFRTKSQIRVSGFLIIFPWIQIFLF